MMENDRPYFSIIIPSYNRPGQLINCLTALAELSYPCDRFEVIVIDDGSDVSYESLVSTFQDQLTLKLLQQENAGPAAARNYGATAAEGEYLAFTDDDCSPDANWLTALAEQFSTTPDCIVGGQTINALVDNLYASASQLIVDIVYRYYNADQKKARFFASNNMAIPTHLFREIGGFNDSFRTAEDRELCDRWLHNGRFMVYAPEAVVYHAHKLKIVSFCKQHFSYGKGAYRYHVIKSVRKSDAWVNTFQFHLNIWNWLLYPYKLLPIGKAVKLSFLLVVWQVANMTGYFWQMFTRREDRIPSKHHHLRQSL